MSQYILALDEGTTSARAILYDTDAKVKAIGQREFNQHYPKPGWVEHNPNELWMAQLTSVKEALTAAKIEPSQVSAIGITNQRETTVIWNKRSGDPIYNAVVWQCRRTAEMVEQIKLDHMAMIKEKTGLVPDSYFSAPKANWILENVPGARGKADRGELMFGTVDSYLLYKLSGGMVHSTDPSNASRTLLYNIHTGDWDSELLEIFNIPDSMLPEVKPSSSFIGYLDPSVLGFEIPITGCAGDQQAALFGHQTRARSWCHNYVRPLNSGAKEINSSTRRHRQMRNVNSSKSHRIKHTLKETIWIQVINLLNITLNGLKEGKKKVNGFRNPIINPILDRFFHRFT